jgi:AcrR family transcriptional regulator
MTEQKTTRPYRMRARAEQEARTRQRIVESAVALHGSLGPARTSMSAIAANAGVRRSTLYRHFPDESAVFDACTAHWGAANPPPELAAWAAIASPDERLRTGLAELFAFYERAGDMLANLYRDEAVMPLVAERFAAFHGYLDAARRTLAAGRALRGAGGRRIRAALGHAVAFGTWRSLVREQGLPPADAVALLCAMVGQAGTAAPGS